MKYLITSVLFKIAAATLCLYFWDASFLAYLMVGVFVVYASVMAIGSFKIALGFFIPTTNKVNKGVALTFDDGPDPIYTPQILAVLEQYSARATFFVIGSKAEKHPDLLREIVAKGHQLANHSYHHKWYYPFLGSKAIVKDYLKTNTLIQAITNAPVSYLRPPFGATSPGYRKAISKLGMVCVGWSVRTFDTVKTSAEIIEKCALVSEGDIVLMHDTKEETVKALPHVLLNLQQRGLKCIALA